MLLALARSSRWLDVLVEPEEVRGIVLVLQGHQPGILAWAVGCLDPVHVVLRFVVDIQTAGRKGLQRPPELPHPADDLCILCCIGPHPDNEEVVGRLSVIDRRLVCTYPTRPSAVTTSTDRRLSQARPYVRIR